MSRVISIGLPGKRRRDSIFLPQNKKPAFAGFFSAFLFPVSEEAEKVNEDVDEIQVQSKGTQDGYFTPDQRQALFERIHASGAKIVTVAMGSPKQEILMRDCRQVHPDALYMGVGGTYDVFTGHVKRAPKVWQNLGLEWLYRLLSQPSRIKRQLRLLRYLRWHYTNNL